MGGSKGGRDMASRRSRDGTELKLTSRHGFDVATWATVWDVATWAWSSRRSRHGLGRPGGRDMGLMSRPGLLNLGS